MITYRWLAVARLSLVAMGLLTLGGCGGGSVPTYGAGGKVVFPNGEPLGGGKVEFRPVAAPQPVVARGEIQPDGSFRLSTFRPNDGAVEGEHVVLVVPPLPESRPGEPPRRASLLIDSRLTQFDTSGLKFTVTRDPAKNQFTIQVDRPRK
jgi:hypothetical protein